ncbi:MAG TPA: tRNA (N6-isopentenyl adenosine(37)-C2)-methylthiotransferase MiaB [Candidatus Onthocola stercoravium]|nr:tRNA (N6-isopentenyl adenosine(37)-C2)-methylthiotransferase MiaB [Candidatus Onthocola stercoravium]
MNKPDLCVAKNREKVTINHINLDMNIKPVFNGKKYFLRTYGCQMNVHDSEEIKYYLEKLGYEYSDTLEDADIVVLNTCAIRENAKDKVFGYLGRCKHLKKIKKDLIICLCGCLTQQPSEVETIMDKHKYVDIVIGTHNLSELPKLIIEANGKQNIEVYSNSDKVFENVKYSRDSKISAWINIQLGCDKFCTYCIVPYTRGRERSRKIEEILKEVQELKKQGYMEITLLGQNVNAYGKDLNLGYDFATLLEETAKIGIPRVRFVTSHPWNFTDKMIDVIAKYPNIMPYIHLPIQSGSDEILKKMNRRYTVEEYKKLFDTIKEKVQNVSITTDIIVGFPNETEEDFKRTLDIVNYCKFDGAFTFIFSPRVGTAAALMEDKISKEEKEERLHRLNEVVNKYSLESNKKYLGKVVEVLITGPSDKGEDKVCGYTDTMKLVNVVGSKDLIGKIVKVKIADAKSFSLDGVVC